jgi:hypothetical protein
MLLPHNYHYYANTVNFNAAYDDIAMDLLNDGVKVDTGHWQAQTGTPMTQSVELQYVNLVVEMPPTAGSLAAMVKPNLPWADEHFAERVSGIPYNPPPSHVDWPYAQKDNAEHVNEAGKFSHTYPERLWPKTPEIDVESARIGIRFEYGDLGDAVELLGKHPHTRQCFVPLWFPEDLYAATYDRERVPCTLGYHFMMRKDRLHCFYPMRSCDLLRYFRDDLYMAGRLQQWMLERVRLLTANDEGKSPWDLVEVGQLVMLMCSLHCFEGDLPMLKQKYGRTKRGAYR